MGVAEIVKEKADSPEELGQHHTAWPDPAQLIMMDCKLNSELPFD